MESIAHELKKTIGTGGTAKNGMIVLQGDHRSKVTEFLLTKGYSRESIEVIWLIENNIQWIFYSLTITALISSDIFLFLDLI